MIRPTVGRVVWYTPGPSEWSIVRNDNQPCVAHITYVIEDWNINVVVFDHAGNMHALRAVFLCQDNHRPTDHGYCEWMPYQTGQAAKAEALEAKLKETTNG